MKKLLIGIIAYTMLFLVLFSATFSTGDGGGLGIIVDGEEWITFTANIISNFVVVLNITILILSAVFIIAMVYDPEKYITDVNKQMVDKLGVIKAGNMIEFKPLRLYLISIPSWVYLVASGWIFTALCFMIITATAQVQHFLQRQHLKENYLNEDSSDSGDASSTDDLKRNPI